MRLLVVEDQKDLNAIIVRKLGREGYAVDLLVPEDEYMENYYGRPQRIQVQGVIDHLHVISEFYQTIADYLDEMVDKYEPKGFKYIAISAPV